MITQNASAEFGNFMGGIISTSIKSGTNQFHGDVFEFFRNDVLNANSLDQQLAAALPNPSSALEYVRRDAGRSDQERQAVLLRGLSGTALRHFPNSTGTIPLITAAERQGDFSRFAPGSEPDPALQSLPIDFGRHWNVPQYGHRRMPHSVCKQPNSPFASRPSGEEPVRFHEVPAANFTRAAEQLLQYNEQPQLRGPGRRQDRLQHER